MLRKYLVGADPEVFVLNPNSNGFVTALGLIPGTKYAPHPVHLGAVQVDGMAAEFNIEPAKSADEFVINIREVYNQLRNLQPGYNFVARPAVMFDPIYFGAADPESKTLGCDPDYCAWTETMNEVDQSVADTPLRTGSGHLHIGWTEGQDPLDNNHFIECCERVKQLDYYLGIYSLLWDPDPTRRQLYGKAGAFRPKPYGLEYRTLSNRWLDSEPLQRWIYHAAMKAMDDFDKGERKHMQYDDFAQVIIDTNAVDWQSQMDFDTGLVQPPRLKALEQQAA